MPFPAMSMVFRYGNPAYIKILNYLDKGELPSSKDHFDLPTKIDFSGETEWISAHSVLSSLFNNKQFTAVLLFLK